VFGDEKGDRRCFKSFERLDAWRENDGRARAGAIPYGRVKDKTAAGPNRRKVDGLGQLIAAL